VEIIYHLEYSIQICLEITHLNNNCSLIKGEEKDKEIHKATGEEDSIPPMHPPVIIINQYPWIHWPETMPYHLEEDSCLEDMQLTQDHHETQGLAITVVRWDTSHEIALRKDKEQTSSTLKKTFKHDITKLNKTLWIYMNMNPKLCYSILPSLLTTN